MVKKAYTITLDKEAVDEVLILAEFYGGKLSPIINSLLKDWIKEKKEEVKKI